MRGEPNKKWNKRITRPCPMCGGRVIVAHRNQSWWIRCDDDPFHIKYKPYEDPYSAIRAFNAQTNADRIRSMSDEELAAWILREPTVGYFAVCPPGTKDGEDCPTSPCEQCWLDWLKSPAEVET